MVANTLTNIKPDTRNAGPTRAHFGTSGTTYPVRFQHQARFFNTEVESALDRLFMELDSLRTAAGESVLQVIGNDGEPTIIWRARRAGSQSQLQTILANPASEMGPPPPGITPAGRMNAAGIPVFYGALDYDTCIAEIRPPVGSYVVTGKFELLKPRTFTQPNPSPRHYYREEILRPRIRRPVKPRRISKTVSARAHETCHARG